jgi:hypothetical protein
MERCPCCNARLREVTSCPRCQADLTILNDVEQMAKLWLKKAINYWLDSHVDKSLDALALSLHLKTTKIAVVFQDFIIQQQCQKVLDLLLQKQLYLAKQSLFKMRHLFLYYRKLQQLNLFVDSLLIKGYRDRYD